jgi:hypothetical protein
MRRGRLKRCATAALLVTALAITSEATVNAVPTGNPVVLPTRAADPCRVASQHPAWSERLWQLAPVSAKELNRTFFVEISFANSRGTSYVARVQDKASRGVVFWYKIVRGRVAARSVFTDADPTSAADGWYASFFPHALIDAWTSPSVPGLQWTSPECTVYQ